jgi:hypothetical protein
MTSFGRIGVGAACAVVLVVMLEGLLVPELSAGARFWYGTATRVTLYALGAIAAGMAAGKFGWWSEHVGRAWTLFSVEFFLLLVNFVLRRAFPDARLALNASLIVANLAQIGAYWLMARTLTAAGLDYYGSRAKRIVIIAAALALAILLCYSSLTTEWQSIQAGEVRPGRLVSVLSDIITFVLIAPLLLTTFTLRGGRLFWIFGFLAISVFGWMVNQAGTSIGLLLGGGNEAARVARFAGVAVASLFNAAAAVTQWLAADRAMRESHAGE